ncbi:uncharacterized protein B0H18DRAFT_1047635 [Fomitopsis serialis]|uniref:uncharacterized protein n=1 Tax=Fomitopsis serialis TaxID=139415 RepID=UPI0020078BA1|nr:uncharacterized protein B0H18DRAFT_1047635 [Neoantrodia serialis]KAH9913764.1 hypothetical protein B0H18DRAFT_1047635 [Neoantrodia serialis]
MYLNVYEPVQNAKLYFAESSYANLQSSYRKAKERNDVLEGENARLQRELDVTRQTFQVTAVKIEDAAQSARAAGVSKSYMEIKEELNDVLHQRTVDRLEHESAIDALSAQLENVKAKHSLATAKQLSAVGASTSRSFPAASALPSIHRTKLTKCATLSDESTQAANSSSDSEPISSLVSSAKVNQNRGTSSARIHSRAYSSILTLRTIQEQMNLNRQNELRNEPSSSGIEKRCNPIIRQRKRSLADEHTESRKKLKQS